MIRTNFPALNRHRLKVQARSHADLIAWERSHGDSDCDNDDRLVVNMLRHEYTDYDDDQSADRYAAANRAIAARFPWLTAECARQTQRRTETERAAAEALAEYLCEQADMDRERRATIAASRDLCASFHVGQPIEVTIKGHHRCATVVKVGRSRLTVEYRLKTGTARTAVVYASTVRLP